MSRKSKTKRINTTPTDSLATKGPSSFFFRLLHSEDKGEALAQCVSRIKQGAITERTYLVLPESFRKIPGSPFAYWVGDAVRRLFANLPPFESDGRTVRQGLATADDFRFVRTWWEVPPDKVVSGNVDTAPEEFRKQTFEGKRWVPFAKGGEYSPYYADIHLVVNWERDGQDMKEFPSSVIRNPSYYFRPGLTWPRRTTSGFSARVLPAGCIFADKGPAAFGGSAIQLLPLIQSRSFQLMISLQVAAATAAARSYEVGLIQQTPIPELRQSDVDSFSEIGRKLIDLKRESFSEGEIAHDFRFFKSDGSPSISGLHLNRVRNLEKMARDLKILMSDIDERVSELYGTDLRFDEFESTARSSGVEDADPEAVVDDEGMNVTLRTTTLDLISYSLGCSFGRWDLRYATGSLSLPALRDLFAPLPISSLGMLQDENGIPMRNTPDGYSIDIDRDGILVDDPDHPDDIIRRTRDVFEAIWKKKTEEIENESCQILGVKELRAYFRRPGNGGFWMDHVKRYSKSRRKAPIYWLLQSTQRNYGVWLYYHRLDKDTLSKVLVNYVEPKIRNEEALLERIRAEKGKAGASPKDLKKLEKEQENQEEFLSELRDFHDKLRRVADLHLEPDLNDGVVLNIAPLRELVPWKEARDYWDELVAGKYDWSSIGKQLRSKSMAKDKS